MAIKGGRPGRHFELVTPPDAEPSLSGAGGRPGFAVLSAWARRRSLPEGLSSGARHRPIKYGNARHLCEDGCCHATSGLGRSEGGYPQYAGG
jgi:hypothetical protein